MRATTAALALEMNQTIASRPMPTLNIHTTHSEKPRQCQFRTPARPQIFYKICGNGYQGKVAHTGSCAIKVCHSDNVPSIDAVSFSGPLPEFTDGLAL